MFAILNEMENTRKRNNKISYTISSKLLLGRPFFCQKSCWLYKKSEAKKWLTEARKLREEWIKQSNIHSGYKYNNLFLTNKESVVNTIDKILKESIFVYTYHCKSRIIEQIQSI